MINIKVAGSVVSVQETQALYCGSQDVYTCCFEFDSSWESFSKSAVFRTDGKTITVLLDEENKCDLPWELLVRGNIGKEVEVGVYGISAEAEILTSVWDSLGAVREGSELGNDAREPSAGVYEQVMANLLRVDDKVGNYNAEVRSLVQRAESAAAQTAEGIDIAKESAKIASVDAQAAERAYTAVKDALDNLPQGGTLVINDLTTGGTAAALSAEMGKVLAVRSNPNLLHNWYFVNPVNQKGFAEEAGSTSLGYLIDRWTRSGYGSGVLSLSEDGLSIDGTATSSGANQIFQKLESALPHGTYTLSFLATEVSGTGTSTITNADGKALAANPYTEPGLYSLTYTGEGIGRVYFGARAGSKTNIRAVKLEMGDTQTLAHQDANGNWVLNEVPDCAAELAKCQRHQLRVAYKEGANYYVNIGAGVAGSAGTTIRVTIPTPVTMRASPAVSYLSGGSVSGFAIRHRDGTLTPTAVSTIVYDNGVMLILTVSGAIANDTYIVDVNPKGFILDANL